MAYKKGFSLHCQAVFQDTPWTFMTTMFNQPFYYRGEKRIINRIFRLFDSWFLYNYFEKNAVFKIFEALKLLAKYTIFGDRF